MTSNRDFFVFYTTFFLFITQIIGMMAVDIPTDLPIDLPNLSPDSSAPTGLTGAVTSFFNNVVFFFDLMTVNSTYFLFGAVIVSPFLVGVTWALIEIIKDIIPFT